MSVQLTPTRSSGAAQKRKSAAFLTQVDLPGATPFGRCSSPRLDNGVSLQFHAKEGEVALAALRLP